MSTRAKYAVYRSEFFVFPKDFENQRMYNRAISYLRKRSTDAEKSNECNQLKLLYKANTNIIRSFKEVIRKPLVAFLNFQCKDFEDEAPYRVDFMLWHPFWQYLCQ